MTRRLSLRSHPDALPLGWEVADRLSGRKREGPYRVGTATPTGKALSKQLAALGIGRKRIVVEGRFQPADTDSLKDLAYFSRQTDVAGTLDAESLGRVVHELVRRFRETEKARLGGADTPREAYVTAISIRTIEAVNAPKPERRVRGQKVRRVFVRYLDTETGKFVKADTWKRSRRSIRSRTPKGQAPKAGRYVRKVYEA